MRELGRRVGRLLGNTTRPTETARLVIGAGVLMILAQLVFRAWALYPSWFYLDDYNLLLEARGQRLDLEYLLAPYNSHLMPGGRLLAWLVADSGQLNWALAATLTLFVQALASVAALWMLTTLFGVRWATLAPLALYLSSAMTVPATMWWTAGVNQIPLQLAFFLSVGAWVHYLRSRRVGWLLATVCALVLGLLFYVKALLILPVLAFIVVAYFASGTPTRRLRTVVGRYWPSALAGALVAGGYLAYYLSNVQQPFTETTVSLVADIADSMLGSAFVAAVMGGPWRWSAESPPNAFADPPDWTLHLAWVAVALVILYGALRRTGTLRAWVLLLGYLVGLLALLVNSRAPAYGRIIGLEYRYLTDAACAVALCVGLAFLPLLGADQPSRARAEPLLRVRIPPVMVVVLVFLVCGSAVISSARYVSFWHSQNASDAYVHNLDADLREQGAIDLADTAVPEEVISAMFTPDNAVRRLVTLVSTSASFPRTSAQLAVVGPDGTLRRALIGPGVRSKPGPKPDCGWLVKEAGREIELTERAFPWEWWVRIGYLASQDSPVEVRAGSDRVSATVEAGLNNLYVKVDGGAFDTVTIEGLDAGASMCVDTIEVGQPVPGGRLP